MSRSTHQGNNKTRIDFIGKPRRDVNKLFEVRQNWETDREKREKGRERRKAEKARKRMLRKRNAQRQQRGVL